MKKCWMVFIVYFLIGCVLFVLIDAFTPLNLVGDFKEIEYVRKSCGYYQNAKMICSQQTAERYVDFILDEKNDLYIITIEIDHSFIGAGYELGEVIGFYTDLKVKEIQENFNENQEILWENANKKDKNRYSPISWTLMPSSFELREPNVSAYPFAIGDNQYVLYVKDNG